MPITTKQRRITLRVRVPEQIHLLIVYQAEDQLRTYHDQAKFLMMQGLGWRPMPLGLIHIQPEPRAHTIPINMHLTTQERADLQTIADANYRPSEDMAAYAIAKAMNCTDKTNREI
jgi:hypothetical protein